MGLLFLQFKSHSFINETRVTGSFWNASHRYMLVSIKSFILDTGNSKSMLRTALVMRTIRCQVFYNFILTGKWGSPVMIWGCNNYNIYSTLSRVSCVGIVQKYTYTCNKSRYTILMYCAALKRSVEFRKRRVIY